MDSGDYKKYLKDCNTKKKNNLTLDGAFNDLKKFERVKKNYSNFEKAYKKYKNTWKEINNSWLVDFKDYEWYYNKIKKIDEDLKNKNAIE